MKLTYRGVNYDYNPPQAPLGGSVATGQYRGAGVKFRNLQKEIVQQPSLDLKYRGVAYTTTAPESAIPEVISASITDETAAKPALAIASIDEQLRSLMLNHHRNVKQREQVMLSRLAAQVGLPNQYAYQYWNPIQGKVSPVMAETYNRSHVAFS